MHIPSPEQVQQLRCGPALPYGEGRVEARVSPMQLFAPLPSPSETSATQEEETPLHLHNYTIFISPLAA